MPGLISDCDLTLYDPGCKYSPTNKSHYVQNVQNRHNYITNGESMNILCILLSVPNISI